MSFTHVVLFGALVLRRRRGRGPRVMRVVTGRRPGGFEVLEAVAVSGAVAMVQFLMVSDGFGRLHVAYLWVFVTLPIIGAVVLVAAVVPALRPQRWGAIAAGGLLSLAVVGLYATYLEPRWIRTERVALDVAPLEGADELRIGVLSDLQTDGIGCYEYDAVDRLMAEEPDVIVVPGDVFQSDGPDFEAALPELRALLGRLEAPGGVFITEGDVDSPERMAFMSDGMTNLTWLDDEVVTTEVRGMTVHIGGISVRFRDALGPGDHRRAGRHRRRGLCGSCCRTGPTPRSTSRRGAPTWSWPATPTGARWPSRSSARRSPCPTCPRAVAAGGLHEIDGTPIYLSNGVGMERATAPQVRFNSRPSIGIVTLT